MKDFMKWARPAVQAVISVLLLYMLISCGLLPAKYLGIAVAAVVVLFLISSDSEQFQAVVHGGIGMLTFVERLLLGSVG